MQGPRRVLASVDEAAEGLGLRCGMTVTHAQSLVPDLALFDATLEADEKALIRLAPAELKPALAGLPDWFSA